MGKAGKSYNPLLKSYPDSEKINRVSEGAEVLYVRLLAASDDDHHYYADAQRVLAKLFTERMVVGTVTEEAVAARLDELDREDLIRLYEVGGKQYLEIVQCFKRFRKDVKFDKRFPAPESPPLRHAARTRAEDVTHASRARAEYKTVDVPAASYSATDSTQLKHTYCAKQIEAELIQLWANTEGVRPIRGVQLTDARRRQLVTRLKVKAWWKEVKEALQHFPLKCFEGDDNWRPTLDWFLKPDTVAKIVEGKYDWKKGSSDDRGKSKTGPGQRHPDDAGRKAF